jgi:CheY-like chemotaxis protein
MAIGEGWGGRMSALQGMTILIVEDEPIVAMLIEDMLAELGAEALGPATCLSGALDMAVNATFNAAIVDLNLNGERTGPVAQVLRERGLPFVVATGYGSDGGAGVSDAPMLQKPYRMEQMEVALNKAITAARLAKGAA